MSKTTKITINERSTEIVEYVAGQKGLEMNAAADYLLGIAYSRYAAVSKYAEKRPKAEKKAVKKTEKKAAKKATKKAAKKTGKSAKDKTVKRKKKAEAEVQIEDESAE